MSILYLLVPIAMIFLVFAVLFFFWAIKNGQYDDMESQALKIVIDDNQAAKKSVEDLNTNQTPSSNEVGDRARQQENNNEL